MACFATTTAPSGPWRACPSSPRPASSGGATYSTSCSTSTCRVSPQPRFGGLVSLALLTVVSCPCWCRPCPAGVRVVPDRNVFVSFLSGWCWCRPCLANVGVVPVRMVFVSFLSGWCWCRPCPAGVGVVHVRLVLVSSTSGWCFLSVLVSSLSGQTDADSKQRDFSRSAVGGIGFSLFSFFCCCWSDDLFVSLVYCFV